jgi:TRAP-type C4-dicarboxylate transport system permease small subunit
MKRPLRLSFIYNHFEELFLVLLFAFMVAIIFIQVIMRYVFNNALSWSEETGRFTFEWLTWIGISIGARMGEHIKITMLTDRLPFRGAQAMNILSEIIVIGICVITSYTGVILARTFSGSYFTMMHISLAWGYAAPITGCAIMTVRASVSIARSLKLLAAGPPPAKADEAEGSEA